MSGLKQLNLILKIVPFITETDSMSVKFIYGLKDLKGVFARWLTLIEEFSFVVLHAKVVVKDCISREPRHLPPPTQDDLLWE